MLKRLLLIGFMLGIDSLVYGDELVRTIPDEYESIGGNGLGIGNSGVSEFGGVASVQTNPALLPLEKVYTIDAGYHWPTSGRRFLQAGIVDSKTSKIAAGLSYTGLSGKAEDEPFSFNKDSQADRRISLGLGGLTQWVSLGVSMQYIEGVKRTEDPLKFQGWEKTSGSTVGFGIAGAVFQNLKLGASIVNLRNSGLKDLAPTTARVGGTLSFFGNQVVLGLEGLQRERISSIEGNYPDVDIGLDPSGTSLSSSSLSQAGELGSLKPEKMVIGSLVTHVYNLLRLSASYGSSVDKSDPRQSLSGGIGLEQNHFGITYMLSKPYISESEIHSALNINIQAAI